MQVQTVTDGPVLVITLDRPKANAIDVPTSRSLYAAFDRLRSEPGLRVAVLTGAGERFFSAGSVRRRSKAACRARLVATSIALAFGRSKVMTRTGPSTRASTSITLHKDAAGTGR